MRVYVTWEDIKKGRQLCANCCPVALSLMRHLDLSAKDIVTVATESYVASKSAHLKDRMIKHPEHVVDRIRDFDAGKGMKPFSFLIRVPKGLRVSTTKKSTLSK